MTTFTDIAVNHVYLVTSIARMPISGMYLLTTSTGRQFTFARHVLGARMSKLRDIDEAGREYEPPLVMTISRQGYLLSIVEQGDEEGG